MIDYKKFQKSLKHLDEQNKNFKSLDPAYPTYIKEAMAESVIQRFEICYDCLWKVLRRYLIEELGLAEVQNSPKPIFRLAHENNVLPLPIEKWIEYANDRINTTHDYSGEKAIECLNNVDDFINSAKILFQTMSKETFV